MVKTFMKDGVNVITVYPEKDEERNLVKTAKDIAEGRYKEPKKPKEECKQMSLSDIEIPAKETEWETDYDENSLPFE